MVSVLPVSVYLDYKWKFRSPVASTCLEEIIVPRHFGLVSLTSVLGSTNISTKKGWCPLEMAKFSDGRYDAPHGPLIGGP